MTTLEIRSIDNGDPRRFEVRVIEGNDATRHEVSLSRAQFDALAAGSATPEECVEAAFRFLLDREPKEAILKRFDVAVIASYFPEFPREFPRYLPAR
ncbi:MAG TPA: hypothetical protein VGL35_10525 [Rhizomicrobium sp.]|jgi:hypothetical protein